MKLLSPHFCTLVCLILGLSYCAPPPPAGSTAAATPGQLFVHPDGDDGHDGRAASPDYAFQTLQRAVDAMAGGDEIVLADGTYTSDEMIQVKDKSGTAERPTVIRAANPRGARLRFTGRKGGLRIRDSHWVRIEGLDIAAVNPDRDDNQMTGLESYDSDHLVFRNNYVHDCGCGGISFREGDYVDIDGNTTRDNAKKSRFNCSGISIYQPEQLDSLPGFHLVVRNNTSYENECDLPFDVGAGDHDTPTDGNGIILDDFNNSQRTGYAPYRAGTLIENNLVYDNGGAGIKVYEGSRATIRNNTVRENNRILRNYPKTPGDISVIYSTDTFRVYNNHSRSRNDPACSALEYINVSPSGFMDRRGNTLVGAVRMPDRQSSWAERSDTLHTRAPEAGR